MAIRKFLLTLALLFGLAVPAFSTTTQLIGTVADASGNLVSGQACFQLPVNAVDTSTSRALSPRSFCYNLVNGTFPTFATVVPNDVIQPSGTYYSAFFYDQAGKLIFNANYVIPTGVGTFNVGTAIPTSVITSNISYASPALTTGNNVLTGINTFTGTVHPCRIGLIRFVDASTGALCWGGGTDPFAWEMVAQADLIASSAGGGIVDARGLGAGPYTTTTQFLAGNVASQVTFLHDSATRIVNNYAGGATKDAIVIANGSGIVCSSAGIFGGGGGGGIYLGPSANVRHFVTNDLANLPQASATLERCSFQGNNSAIVASALYYFASLADETSIVKNSFNGAMNGTTLQLDAVVNMVWDNEVNGTEGVPGLTNVLPCYVTGSVTGLAMKHLCSHATSGLPSLKIDGSVGINSPIIMSQISFDAFYVEGVAASGNGVELKDVAGVTGGLTCGGFAGTGSACVKITESISGNNKAINLNVLNGFSSCCLYANSIIDSSAGGATITTFPVNPYIHAASNVTSWTDSAGFHFNGPTAISAITNSTGLQLFSTSTTCSTSGVIDNACTTAAITLPIAYADTNYRLSCTGQGPTNLPIVQTYTKSNTTFTITIVALTAAVSTFSSYDCMAQHN